MSNVTTPGRMALFSTIAAAAAAVLTACGPAPTAEPTDTPVPTETPTSAPTATPTMTPTPPPTPTAVPGGVEGILFRSDTGQPFGSADVFVEGVATEEEIASTVTDAEGHYSLDGLPPGNYSLWAYPVFSTPGESPCRMNPGEVLVLEGGTISWLFLTNKDGKHVLFAGPFNIQVASGEVLEFDIDLIAYDECPH